MARPAILPATGLYATLRWDSSSPPQQVGSGDAFAFARRRPRLILLIPGYNVSESRAQAQLSRFEGHLQGISARLAADVGWLVWRGDWAVPRLGGLAYPFKVAETRHLGKLVADFIVKLRRETSRNREVVLVAHSLGCKLALEAVECLRAAGVPGKGVKLFLMAAAVAIDEVGIEGRPLFLAARHPVQRGVLHSRSDLILRTMFRLGQAVAPGVPWWSGAVGVAGDPRSGWTFSEPMRGFGHGAYWGHRHSADKFAHFMGSPNASTGWPVRDIAHRPGAGARDLAATLPPPRRPGPRHG
jgi:hypothetical protein